MKDVIQFFLNQVMEKSPLQFKSVHKYVEDMCDFEREKLERRIEYFLYRGETYESIADAYLKYCFYFMEERKYFVRNGTYRYTSFNEIAYLYEDKAYMKNCMIGLSIAVYLWKIQRESMQFFRTKCQIDKHQGGRYLEVGPGHGEYLVTALENTSYDKYLAVDISYTAAEMTKSFLQFALKNDEDKLKKVKIENMDFLNLPYKEKYDAIVMSEVIEHVENPKSFLVQVKNLAQRDAFIYLSTAINSPFLDHLYHFHNKEEVYFLLEEAGFKIVDEVFSTAEGRTIENAISNKYDITAGFILSL